LMEILEYFKLGLVDIFEILCFIETHNDLFWDTSNPLVIFFILFDIWLLDLPLLLLLFCLLLLRLANLELWALTFSVRFTTL
jgi:hypothetical protein